MLTRALISALLLAGCPSANDIKPGTIRGVDSASGYVKTTEGFGIALRGCQDADTLARLPPSSGGR